MLHETPKMPTIARIMLATLLSLLLIACEQAPRETEQPSPQVEEEPVAAPADNPLLERYLTPFRTPPFHRLEAAHFLPALDEAFDEHQAAIAEIVASDEAPGFANTIEALERAGRDLERIERTFFGLLAVSDDPELHAIAAELSGRLAAHDDAMLMDRALFERIESVHEQLDDLSLEPQQQRLTELTHRAFVGAGAHLDEAEQDRLQAINNQLAEMGGTFDLSLRKATNESELLIDDETLLDTLPESLVNLAARNARDRGHATGWSFTLHAHSFYPFLMHFPEREQRQAIYEAWIDRIDDALAEKMHDMAELRAERANLLGFDSHIEHLLAESSIGDLEHLRAVLDDITQAASDRAGEEMEQLQELARADGIDGELEPWDWWFYRERLRETEMGQTDAELRNWFSLEQVRDGAFALANRLWGLSFHARTDVPLWYTDVETFEIRDAMGEHLGVIYLDYRHRAGKRAGDWTSVYRLPYRDGEDRIKPVVANVANFPPPAAGLPSLLPSNEVHTLFRQFGHALSELFSQVDYGSLAGSTTTPDFAGLPARLMQRWALQPEVLRMYSFHHETGGMITDDAIEALATGQRLLGGLETLQEIAAIEFELALHGSGPGEVPAPSDATAQVRDRLALPSALSPDHHEGGMTTLFSGRREQAHFQTLWSEILAADAFASFEQSTILDRTLAEQLRNEVMAYGNARAPMESWRAFRDREPRLRYLLEARGLAD